MRGDSGQASVEWIGLVLLLALGAAALVRLAPRADAEALGPELLHAIGCAARGGCDVPNSGKTPRRMISVPPLVPITVRGHPAPAARWSGRRGRRFRGRALLRGRVLARRAGRGAGMLWRRSWMLCLGYERVRYGFLHPEVRYPQMPIPLSEDLRMVNDCLSPVDLVRDWDLIRGQR